MSANQREGASKKNVQWQPQQNGLYETSKNILKDAEEAGFFLALAESSVLGAVRCIGCQMRQEMLGKGRDG